MQLCIQLYAKVSFKVKMESINRQWRSRAVKWQIKRAMNSV